VAWISFYGRIFPGGMWNKIIGKGNKENVRKHFFAFSHTRKVLNKHYAGKKLHILINKKNSS